MSAARPTPRPGPGRGARIGIVAVVSVIGAALAAAFLVWLVFFSDEAPEAPTLEGAAAVLAASPGPLTAAATDPSPAADGTDGTWVVDTSIGGSVDESSYVGFRVAEVLDRIGETEAIGRTPVVSGSLTLSGSALQGATIEADLTRIASDQSRRDPAIQRALDTGSYPVATFESSQAVELPSMPTEDESITVTVPGVLTIHGVSQDVVAQIEAQRVGDVVVVVGQLPVDFTSFGITMPTAPIVVSVEDSGHLEWQIFFRRQA